MRFTMSGYQGCALVLGALALVSLQAYVAAGNCGNVEWGVDYEGGWNLNEGKQTYTSSDWECCNKCNQNYKCKSWSRVKYSKGNLRKGDCWLHGGGQYKKYKDWINSGKKGGGGGGGDSCSVQRGLDITGGNTINNGKWDQTSSDGECCRKCNARSDCKYWTRTQYYDQGSQKGECWLRSSIGRKIWNSWAFNSGEKKWYSSADDNSY